MLDALNEITACLELLLKLSEVNPILVTFDRDQLFSVKKGFKLFLPFVGIVMLQLLVRYAIFVLRVVFCFQ